MLKSSFYVNGMGGGKGFKTLFYNLILFYIVFTKLQDAFYRYFILEMIFAIYPVKVGGNNRFLMGGAN